MNIIIFGRKSDITFIVKPNFQLIPIANNNPLSYIKLNKKIYLFNLKKKKKKNFSAIYQNKIFHVFLNDPFKRFLLGDYIIEELFKTIMAFNAATTREGRRFCYSDVFGPG